ncbi:MAG TPA: PucR family transcriptional regulator [Solirubrobacteraceae bacterium]|nr:PucR family transcriptional regulator [Solirubrobacteraceae bacterium]
MSVQTAASTFRLKDLLGHDELGLKLLTGAPKALDRRVAGAHAIEIERPTTWLEPDWIMLTTGARLRRSSNAQRALVAELEASGAAALGFGVEVVFRTVPPALLDEARERAFPLFTVPLEIPFRDVIGTINRALLSSDLRTLQRVSSMQLYLMDALGEEDPRQAVVDRLATFLDATVLLFAADGVVEASTGEAPTARIWEEATSRPATVVEFDLAEGHVLATPLSVGGAPAGWLAVVRRQAPPSPRLARQAARATAPVLAALGRIDSIARRQQRAVRAALLDEMLGPHSPRDRAAIAARAAALGIDFAAPARVVVVRRRRDAHGTDAEDPIGEALDELTEALYERGVPELGTRRQHALTLLVQAPCDEVRADLARLTGRMPELVAGIGRPASDVDGVVESNRDATIAVQRLDASAGASVLDFEDFDLVTLMISEAPRRRIQPKVDEIMGALSPALHEAVTAYFAHDLDVMAAARAMHLHHNTLRYRLGRAEDALGRPLKDPGTIAMLYVALAAERVAAAGD